MKRAAIYARVSSDQQATEDKVSIEAQLADCEAYCNERGYTIVARYIDKERYRSKGKLVQPSGQRKDRPHYGMMLRAAAAGEFDVIVAWKEDRLYRGMYAAMPFSEVLDEMGKRLAVELVKETFDRKMLGIKAALGKIEADNIRERMVMGRRAHLQKGEMLGSFRQVRYGHKKVDRHLEIEETEAEIVRKIFDWYISGENNMAIRRRLNAMGVPPRRGKIWAKQTLERILTCEAYATGQLLYVLDGESFYIPCPPIISMAVWQKAQEVRTSNRFLARWLKEDYLCAGLVYCACGWKCQARTARRENRKKGSYSVCGYYICQRHITAPESQPPDCAVNTGSKKVDDYVWDFVRELCDRPEVLRGAVLQRLSALEAEQTNLEAEAGHLQRQLDELGTERQWVITQARKKRITEDDMEMQLTGLQIQELGLHKELREVQAKSAARLQVQALSEWAAGYLSEIGEGIKTLNVKPEDMTPEERQALVSELEAWRFAEKFPGDELAQLRWAILEEKRRIIKTIIGRVVVSKVAGPERRKITPMLALQLPQDLEVSPVHSVS
ncbi:MAG: hypothetical protein BroJett011_14450 [Chloroflexota bacterium]|nr:MAG: hypothetical protein BroJett011_14450 [Chloroflexota bacterium]